LSAEYGGVWYADMMGFVGPNDCDWEDHEAHYRRFILDEMGAGISIGTMPCIDWGTPKSHEESHDGCTNYHRRHHRRSKTILVNSIIIELAT